jgi:adhesin transport system membrane fusion protein
VVTAGAPILEVVPVGVQVLVEARIRPADIGFVKVGQPVQVKLSAYEYTIYGGLSGVVQSISPDAMGDPEKAATPEGTWYRAMVRAKVGALAASSPDLSPSERNAEAAEARAPVCEGARRGERAAGAG